MNSIIEKMYGLGPESKPVQEDRRPGYYSTFGYYDDLKNNRPPPTADQGGPTALEIAQQYGYADEGGMLSNGMNAITAAMFGGGMAPIDPGNNAMNPDYAAGLAGDTLGGIGNKGGWGRDILWSTPDAQNGSYGMAQEGTIFETPAGNYTVSKNPWGQYVLVPQEGAVQGNAPYVTNVTSGQHHVGINPETGEVWYQEAAGSYDFSGGGNSYTQTAGAPVAPNAPSNNGGNGGGNDPISPTSPTPDIFPNGQGSTWQEVLNRNGADLESWDPYLGMFTGLGSNPNWASLSPAQVESTFFNLFGDLANANEVYQRLLENLGLV